jgi:hypothetical protein
MYKTLSHLEFNRLMARANRSSQGDKQPFVANIFKQNEMYKLPVNTEPRLDNLTKPNGELETAYNRQNGFLKTLRDEISEGTEIHMQLRMLDDAEYATAAANQPVEEGEAKSIAKLRAFGALVLSDPAEAEKDLLTDLADWFADMVVYIRSEAMKYGLPLEGVLECVMGSNFTKLPSDGIPIHDENGKFLKDMSNYIAPEGAIKTLLFGFNEATEERPVETQTITSDDVGSVDPLLGTTLADASEGTEGRNERV